MCKSTYTDVVYPPTILSTNAYTTFPTTIFISVREKKLSLSVFAERISHIVADGRASSDYMSIENN